MRFKLNKELVKLNFKETWTVCEWDVQCRPNNALCRGSANDRCGLYE